MPYFPTYEEMQDALESARLKMWHEHGKAVEFGGPEFTLYVMEGLGKMEAPRIADEPIEDSGPSGADADIGDASFGSDDPASEGVIGPGVEGLSGAGVAASGEGTEDVKTTVIRSLGADAAVAEVRRDDEADAGHEFVSDRSGKKCLECGEGFEAAIHQVTDQVTDDREG